MIGGMLYADLPSRNWPEVRTTESSKSVELTGASVQDLRVALANTMMCS